MILSVDAEKRLDKVPHLFMITCWEKSDSRELSQLDKEHLKKIIKAINNVVKGERLLFS